MKRQWQIIAMFSLVLACPQGDSVHAQKVPASTTIGSNPAGSLFYSVASGLAKVISGAGPMQAVVQPYTGSSTFLPLLDNGELDFGIVNAVDMGMAYQGPRLKIGGKNPLPHSPNTRLIMRGSPLLTSLVSRKDGPVKTVADVKGKRVTGEYPAHLAVWFSVYGSLATGGLTWDDVKVVPVPAVNDGIDALVQGRAEVSNHTVASAKIKEADAAIGVRFVSLDCSPQGEARLKKAVPGYYLTTLKAGHSNGIMVDTCVQAYDMYLVGHKGFIERTCQRSAKRHLGQCRQARAAPSIVTRMDPRARRRSRRDHGVPSRRSPVLQRTQSLARQNGRSPEKKCWR